MGKKNLFLFRFLPEHENASKWHTKIFSTHIPLVLHYLEMILSIFQKVLKKIPLESHILDIGIAV